MYKQRNNPFNAPILKVDMEDDVQGVANKDGTIHINKDINDPKQIEKIVAHESVHLDQMKRGDLDYTDDKVIWKGKEYSRDKMKEGAKNLPWEKEAYKRQDSFKLGNKKNPYKSFEEKGLISPLAKRKPKKIEVSRTNLDYELPDQGTLYEPRDLQFIEEQNKLQQNKNIIDKDIQDFKRPTTTTSDASEKPSGFDFSADRSLTWNQPGYDGGLAQQLGNETEEQAIGRWILESRLGEANVSKYSNNPDFEYKDKTDGDYEAGYYNVKTGDKAPEVDKSKDLSSSSILQPSSYNLYTDLEHENYMHDGGYTTNYEFKPKNILSGDLKTAQGQQSSVITKGQAGEWDKKGGRKRKSGGQNFKAKNVKTLLPKRKEIYDTYYDPQTNEVVTTKERKFNRLKYNTTDEYYVGSSNNKRARQLSSEQDFVKAKDNYAKMQESQRKKREQMESDLADLRKLYDS